MDLGLTGKVALVGGASRGLGAACAAALAAEGASVALAARPSETLTATAAQVGGAAVAADLSSEQGPAQAVEETVARLGRLDLLVVNSGGPPQGTFETLGEDEWRRAIDGTLQSTLRTIRAALPHLRAAGGGSIAIVLAGSVRAPIPNLVTSNVLRPGLVGLIKTLAGELAPQIRINGVAPGRIATERAVELDTTTAEREGVPLEAVRERNAAAIPLGRYGTPAEFGRIVAFVASPAAAYLTGQVVLVDGGMMRSLP